MANKKQNKDEYVKPHSLSLKPTDYQRYKQHAKRQGVTFSEQVRIFFEEDIENEQAADTMPKMMNRDKLRANRLLKLKATSQN